MAAVTYNLKQPGAIAVLLDNPFESDFRVYMEATSLATRYDVTLFALKDPRLPDHEIINNIKVHRVFENEIHRLPKRKLLKQHARLIASQGFEIIHAHDHLMLDVAYHIKKLQPSCKIVYDSHELFHSWPLNLNNASPYIAMKSMLSRAAQVWLERKHARNIDRLITVNTSLANILTPYFKLGHAAVVLRNTPPYAVVEKGKHLLRKHFKIADEKKILVFIGMHVYPKTLNIEMVMDQVSALNNVAIVLICKDNHNRRVLEQYAVTKGYSDVYFHDILRQQEMKSYLCDCDAGLVPTWNKKDLSYWYALDNKLFNYVMAGIPVLATAQPEYKIIVEGYHIGICVNPDKPDAYANGLLQIFGNIDYYNEKVKEAKHELCWEKESEKLLELYDGLVSS